MDGWIKLHRKFLDWEWYEDNNVKVVFLHLLLLANHEDKKWRGQMILRGQLITSRSHLAKEIGLSEQQIRTSLNKLKSTNEITIKTTSQNTLVTIVKYNDYQLIENKNNQQNNQRNNKRATNK